MYYIVSMNRNNMYDIKEVSNYLADEGNSNEIFNFIVEMLTESELETLSKRWQILKMLGEGKTQRVIANDLKVSLCKVTRGAQLLKNKDSVAAKYLKWRYNYERM